MLMLQINHRVTRAMRSGVVPLSPVHEPYEGVSDLIHRGSLVAGTDMTFSDAISRTTLASALFGPDLSHFMASRGDLLVRVSYLGGDKFSSPEEERKAFDVESMLSHTLYDLLCKVFPDYPSDGELASEFGQKMKQLRSLASRQYYGGQLADILQNIEVVLEGLKSFKHSISPAYHEEVDAVVSKVEVFLERAVAYSLPRRRHLPVGQVIGKALFFASILRRTYACEAALYGARGFFPEDMRIRPLSIPRFLGGADSCEFQAITLENGGRRFLEYTLMLFPYMDYAAFGALSAFRVMDARQKVEIVEDRSVPLKPVGQIMPKDWGTYPDYANVDMFRLGRDEAYEVGPDEIHEVGIHAHYLAAVDSDLTVRTADGKNTTIIPQHTAAILPPGNSLLLSGARHARALIVRPTAG